MSGPEAPSEAESAGANPGSAAAPSGSNARPRAAWKRALTVLVELLLVVGIGWALYRRRGELAQVIDLDLLDVSLMLALCAAAAPIRGIELSTVTRSLGVRVGFTESMALTQAATLLNYLPMQAGTLLRARVLKRHRALSYTRYVAVMTSLVVLAVGTGGVLGLLLLPLVPAVAGQVRTTAVVAFAVVVAAAVVFMVLPLQRVPLGQSFFARRVHDLVSGWNDIKANKRALLVLVATSMSTPILLGLRFTVCFHALSMPVHLLEALLLAAAILVTAPVNLTPGGLGVRELVGTAIGVAAGLNYAQVLAAVTIDRVVSLSFSFLGGGGSWAWLKRRGLV